AMLANMREEPDGLRGDVESGLRFLALSHALLNYLSALGAHRDLLQAHASDALIDDAVETMADWLDAMAQALMQSQPVPAGGQRMEELAQALEAIPEELDQGHRRMQSQLALICRQVMALHDSLQPAP